MIPTPLARAIARVEAAMGAPVTLRPHCPPEWPPQAALGAILARKTTPEPRELALWVARAEADRLWADRAEMIREWARVEAELTEVA